MARNFIKWMLTYNHYFREGEDEGRERRRRKRKSRQTREGDIEEERQERRRHRARTHSREREREEQLEEGTEYHERVRSERDREVFCDSEESRNPSQTSREG